MAESVDATIQKVESETANLLRVHLTVDPDTLGKYTTPGQVIVVRPNETDQLYLAIASAPGEDGLVVLMGPGAAEKVKPAAGGTLKIDPPMGRGFAVDMAKGKNVLLFAVGSAIAPIRPLIQLIRSDRSAYGRVTLYVGAHTDEDFAFRGEHDAWRRDRIDIVKSVSKPWVQDRFNEDAPSLEDAVAYVCGMKPMMEAVTAALVAAGMPAEHIGKNW